MSVSFTKLGLKNNKTEPVKIQIEGNEVEVLTYLPVEKKLNMIINILAGGMEETIPILNPVKVEVFTSLEILYNYTNISFTEKQKENPQKLYDTLEQNGVFDEVVAAIGEKEYLRLLDWIDETLKEYMNYKRSAVGIMEQIVNDYKDVNFDANNIQEKLADPKNLTLLKDVITKLG